MKRLSHALVLIGAVAAPTYSLTSIHVVEVDNSTGGALLDGFTTYDIRINSTGQLWTGSQLHIDLDDGAFFRSGNGNPDGSAPNPALFPLFLDLEFDTHLAEGNGGFGAVDLGGPLVATFPANGGNHFNQFWLPNLGNLFDLTDLNTVRLTVSDNARGTLRYHASVDGEIHHFRYNGSFAKLSGDADGILFGDYDADGHVAQSDLDLVLLNWGLPFSGAPEGWLAHDQFTDVVVDQNELDGVLLNWGNGTPPPTPPDPWLFGEGAGDLDGSGGVGISDLDLVLLEWGGTGAPIGLDEGAVGGAFDGLVSQNEFDAVALNWGNPSEPADGGVPEPVAVFVGLAAVHRRR